MLLMEALILFKEERTVCTTARYGARFPAVRFAPTKLYCACILPTCELTIPRYSGGEVRGRFYSAYVAIVVLGGVVLEPLIRYPEMPVEAR